MTNQELQKLREQITASTLLSQIERAEWIQLLPEMNDAQAAELASILQSAHAYVPKASVLPPPRQSRLLPDEKELPIGVQLAALESGIAGDLPEHATNPPVAAPVVAQPRVIATPVMQPPVISQPVAQPQPPIHARPEWQKAITHELNPHESTLLHQTLVQQENQQAHAKVILTQSIQKPADLETLDMAFLRQGDPKIVFDNLLDAIVAMAKHYSVTDIAGKVEMSPLYRMYYASGLSALNTGTLPEQGDASFFSKEEFEAFTDFRSHMDHIIS
jgi:hypothetical protein